MGEVAAHLWRLPRVWASEGDSTMKLSTAHRKLWKHRHKWRLEITTATMWGHDVEVTAYRRYKNGWWWEDRLPVSVIVTKRGLANAMAAMADKLDRVEAAHAAFMQADSAALEINK
jgi:hypothetical protein